MHVVVTFEGTTVSKLETVLHVGKIFCLYAFTELNFCLLAPSWSPGH